MTAIGLYYYRARWFDPALARFVQADTTGGGDRYAYVLNNPLRYTDPTGQRACEGPNMECWYPGLPVQGYASDPGPAPVVNVPTATSTSWAQTVQRRNEPVGPDASLVDDTVWDRALEGDVGAMVDLIVPSYAGLGGQIAGDVPVLGPVGGSVSVNAQLVFNRVSDELSFQVRWSKGGGVGWGGGVAATAGLVFGWAASESHSAVPWLDIGASAAVQYAGTVDISIPLEAEADPVFGQVPVELYLGGGYGAAFVGVDVTRSDVLSQQTVTIPGAGRSLFVASLSPLAVLIFPSQLR